MKNAGLVIITTFSLLIAACGGQGGFHSDQNTLSMVTATPTDPTFNPRSPYRIENPNHAPVIMGTLEIPQADKNLELKYDKATETFTLSGKYEIYTSDEKASRLLSQRSFSITGKNTGDHPVLAPAENDDNNDERIRARITSFPDTIQPELTYYVIDIFVQKTGIKETMAFQTEITLEDPTLKKSTPSAPIEEKKTEPKKEQSVEKDPPAPEILPQDEDEGDEHEEDGEKGGLYVGTLYQDTAPLFTKASEKPAPPKETPKKDTEVSPQEPPPAPVPPKRPRPSEEEETKAEPQQPQRPRDQAIGMAAKGRLERGTNLIDVSRKSGLSNIHIIYPARNRSYGTWELIEILQRITNHTRKEILPGYTMSVGDLSQKDGGKLIGTAHKSHQNGLDADIAYPIMNINFMGYTKVTNSTTITPALRMKELLEMYEYAIKDLKMVDRIFVNAKIKKALCEFAEKDKDFKDGRATEILRRLRPADGHESHFHLRIRCSAMQPRCRMMVEPPAGSGCNAL